jgi:2-polyprenyl-3-methyl-5-hydroxy-6-metoxy-1,4-benzoquinol methylase
MKVSQEALDDVDRYLRNHDHLDLEDFRVEFTGTKRNIERYVRLRPELKILEVGCGTGWFPILMRLEGYDCEGLEISWQLRDKADSVARKWGLPSSGIRLGNIEDAEIGTLAYDVIVCNAVFEHVEDWKLGLHRVTRALRPGGVLLFSSTNKFSLISGEYRFPLYGWLPDKARYALRRLMQGSEIMKLGVDFHQFRHGQLRRAFQDLGYTVIHDRVDMKEPSDVQNLTKRSLLKLARRNKLVKTLALTFSPATVFTCVK